MLSVCTNSKKNKNWCLQPKKTLHIIQNQHPWGAIFAWHSRQWAVFFDMWVNSAWTVNGQLSEWHQWWLAAANGKFMEVSVDQTLHASLNRLTFLYTRRHWSLPQFLSTLILHLLVDLSQHWRHPPHICSAKDLPLHCPVLNSYLVNDAYMDHCYPPLSLRTRSNLSIEKGPSRETQVISQWKKPSLWVFYVYCLHYFCDPLTDSTISASAMLNPTTHLITHSLSSSSSVESIAMADTSLHNSNPATLLLWVPFNRRSSHGHMLHTNSHSNMQTLIIFCPKSTITSFTFTTLHDFIRS